MTRSEFGLRYGVLLTALLLGMLAMPYDAQAYRQVKYFFLEVYPKNALPFHTISHLPPKDYFHYYGGKAALESVYRIETIRAEDNSLALFQEILKQYRLWPGNYRELRPTQATNQEKGVRSDKGLWYR